MIDNESIFEAWADLDVDPLVDPLVIFFVSFKFHSPLRSFGTSAGPASLGGSDDAVETVIKWLRDGLAPTGAQRKLRRMQKWEWGAVVTDISALAEELASRYEII